MIDVKVRFYGLISDAFDKKEESIQIQKGISIGELYNTRYLANLNIQNTPVSKAINNVLVNEGAVLRHGDIIDLMPPFAGG